MFKATIQLVKPSDQIEMNNQPYRANFYAASRMHTVDFFGPSINELIGMVEQMLISLNNLLHMALVGELTKFITLNSLFPNTTHC